MKKFLTKKNIQQLSENYVEYTEEKLQEFINKGEIFLKKGNELKKHVVNQLLTTTINDVIEDGKNYKELEKRIETIKITADNLATQLYKVVEMYDVTDRPDAVSHLEFKTFSAIEGLSEDLSDLKEIIEVLLSSASDMKRINV